MTDLVAKYPQGIYFETLGVLQYRLGHYQQSITSLEKSLEKTPVERNLPGPSPGYLAFLAMNHFQLGELEQAGRYRKLLNEAMASKQFASDPEVHRFWWETETLFNHAESQKKSKLGKYGFVIGWRNTWGPDSNRLLLNSLRTARYSENHLKWVQLSEDLEKEIVPIGAEPAWAPEGKRQIAYVFEDKVFVCDAEGTNRREIGPGVCPSWSSDGKTLYYFNNKEKWITFIHVADVNAISQKLLECKTHYYPAVSPDGKKVAMQQSSEIVIIDITTRKKLFTHSLKGWNGLLPSWSPDGRFVTFGDYGFGLGVWCLNTESGKVSQLLNGYFTLPRWSPDGKLIACDDRKNGVIEVFRVEHLLLPE